MSDRLQVHEVPASGFWGVPTGSLRITHTPANPFNTDVSTEQTIQQMTFLVRSQAFSAPVNEAVNLATQELPDSADDREIAEAIWWWVKRHVQFVEDEQTMYEQLAIPYEHLDKELLIPPVTLLQMPVPMGDCDDFSMLVAAMLRNVGMEARFVTVAADGAEPNKFSHVFVVTEDEKGMKIWMDASHGFYPGWREKRVYKEREWGV